MGAPRAAASNGREQRADERSYVKFRDEVMAGGASDVPGQDDTAGGVKGWLSIIVIVGLIGALGYFFERLGGAVAVIGLLISIFLHEPRPLRDRPASYRYVGHRVLPPFMGPKLFSFRRGETEYGVRMSPIGAQRPDHRDEQPRPGGAGGRARGPTATRAIRDGCW